MPSADAAFLPERWQGLGCFLGRELALVSAAAREAALREWRDVTETERAIDDRLAVGLVGGTGVGKSTLVNALAGAEISATGERRPTTSRVVAYRHARTRLPEALPRADIADPEVVHGTDALERVVILDFPDFDSVEELHHEVLERFCPHLDVLIVLVDDMKYADARLFELLRRLPQARENLRPVLNKVDRLDRRYAGRWRAVAGEILDDLHAKLEAHAGIRVPREGMLAISAWNAFLAASPGSAGSADSGASAGSGPAACGAGDFPELVRFLHDYRQEKRRRAAKELNLEARKRALARRLAAEALAPEAAERVERGAARLEERSAELRRALAGTPAALFTRDERRRIASASLVRAAGRLGFPVDFLVTLAGHLRLRSRERRAARVAVTPARVCEHYRAYLDAAENAVREAALDLGDLVPGLEGARDDRAEPPQALAAAAEDLQRGLTACEERLARRSRLWNHALPGVVALGWLWSLAYPVVRGAARRLAGEGDASWGSVAKDAFLGLLEGLNPAALASIAVLLVLAYLVSALAVWVRQVQRVEAAVTEAEDGYRRRVREHGEAAVARAREAAERWRAERRELEGLAGGQGDA